MDGRQLEDVSEFKYLGFVLEGSGAYKEKCFGIVGSGRNVESVIRLPVSIMVSYFECEGSCMSACLTMLNIWE